GGFGLGEHFLSGGVAHLASMPGELDELGGLEHAAYAAVPRLAGPAQARKVGIVDVAGLAIGRVRLRRGSGCACVAQPVVVSDPLAPARRPALSCRWSLGA